MFVLIGLMNTVWARPEDIGTWKYYVGFALFIIAILDIINIVRQVKKQEKHK